MAGGGCYFNELKYLIIFNKCDRDSNPDSKRVGFFLIPVATDFSRKNR